MYLCCWNTSYCSQQCQQNHWPNHMARCEQLRHPSNTRVSARAPAAAVPSRSTQALTQVAAAIPLSSASAANAPAPPSFCLVPRVPVPVSQPNSVHNAIQIHYNEESNQRHFMECQSLGGMPIASTAPVVTRTTLRSPLPPVAHSGRKEWELANRGTSTTTTNSKDLPPQQHASMSSVFMAANATSRPHPSFTQPTASELHKPSNASSRAGKC